MTTEASRKIERENSDETVYQANHAAFSGNMTRTEVAQYYSKWSESGQYDMQLTPSRYTGPELVALALASNYGEERASVRILDVGAGTGRLGQELWNLGFRNIDALDPSEGMLNSARERGVYTNFICDFIGVETPVPCADGTYDALTCSGAIGPGHIPVSALTEIVRVVKSGGIICIAMREEYLDLEEYNKLEPLMKNMEMEGKWRVKSRETVQKYFLEKTGIVYQFIVS